MDKKNETSQEVGIVAHVQRFSVHDGGGIRTLVFLKGCPFSCPWCCNPENMSFEPELSYKTRPSGTREVIGKRYSVEELYTLLERDRMFYEESGGGITLSGGEALAQQDFALAVLKRCKQGGLHTAVETTLALPLRDVEAFAQAVDVFLVDFKIAERKSSRELLNIDTAIRDRNVQELLQAGAHVVARMPIIPCYTDGADCVKRNLRRIRELGIERVDILPFHQLGEGKYDAMGKEYALHGLSQLHDEDVIWIADLAEDLGLSCAIHGE